MLPDTTQEEQQLENMHFRFVLFGGEMQCIVESCYMSSYVS